MQLYAASAPCGAGPGILGPRRGLPLRRVVHQISRVINHEVPPSRCRPTSRPAPAPLDVTRSTSRHPSPPSSRQSALIKPEPPADPVATPQPHSAPMSPHSTIDSGRPRLLVQLVKFASHDQGDARQWRRPAHRLSSYCLNDITKPSAFLEECCPLRCAWLGLAFTGLL